MAKSDWQNAIEQLLDLRGWWWQHQRPARTNNGYRTVISGQKGFPDYVAFRLMKNYHQDIVDIKSIRKVVIEAKAGRDKPTPEQEIWLDFFRKAGFEVYVMYPKDRQLLEKVLL